MNRSDIRPIDASFHHGTHRQLLTDVSAGTAPQAKVDALIVPTSRSAHWLREAVTLATKLRCGLVAMCSRAVKAVEIVELGELQGVSVVAVDVTRDGSEYGLPQFSTSQLLERTLFQRSSDTSLKRNLPS